MRRPIVVANWKMNGSLVENQSWFMSILSQQLPDIDIVVAPSFVHLAQAQKYLTTTHISLATQDVSSEANGAYTGQVSVDMIKDFGTHYVILGHSERRSFCSEDSELVAQKTQRVLQSGLAPIVCVGETLEQRKYNKTKDVVNEQIAKVLNLCKHECLTKLIVAYEPVWAIGTGLVATPEQAEEVHVFLREQIASIVSKQVADDTRILYGGSVKPDNASSLFTMPNIDGGLIGGASLNATSFLEICVAAQL